jgi:hypothetical protein
MLITYDSLVPTSEIHALPFVLMVAQTHESLTTNSKFPCRCVEVSNCCHQHPCLSPPLSVSYNKISPEMSCSKVGLIVSQFLKKCSSEIISQEVNYVNRGYDK